MEIDLTRRLFLTQAGATLGALYLDALTPELLAQAHAHTKSMAPAATGAMRFFTPEQAADFDAFSAQIIPTDYTPGAREANVVHCVDYLLSAFDIERQADMRKALAALDEQADKTVPGEESFARLTSDQPMSFAQLTSTQQIELMRAMEKTEAFGLMRQYTIIAFFGDPDLGGNKDEVGWKLLGFDSTFLWQPPFGYYDAHAEEDKA